MRGSDAMQESLFMVNKLNDFVPADHPLRAIRLLVNQALVRRGEHGRCGVGSLGVLQEP